jgi:hypothetical protein
MWHSITMSSNPSTRSFKLHRHVQFNMTLGTCRFLCSDHKRLATAAVIAKHFVADYASPTFIIFVHNRAHSDHVESHISGRPLVERRSLFCTPNSKPRPPWRLMTRERRTSYMHHLHFLKPLLPLRTELFLLMLPFRSIQKYKLYIDTNFF